MFSNLLANELKKKGIPNRKIAEIFGVSPQAISHSLKLENDFLNDDQKLKEILVWICNHKYDIYLEIAEFIRINRYPDIGKYSSIENRIRSFLTEQEILISQLSNYEDTIEGLSLIIKLKRCLPSSQSDKEDL